MGEQTQDSNPIVRMLLENLTASLTQLVVRYEAISRDCERLEQNVSSMAGSSAGSAQHISEIKDCLTRVRIQCEQNNELLKQVISTASSAKEDVVGLVSEANRAHDIHSEKIDALSKSLDNVMVEVKTGISSVETKQDDLRSKMDPISKFSKLASTPLAIAIFIVLLAAAIWTIVELSAKTRKAVKRNHGSDAALVVSTNGTQLGSP